MTPDEQAYVLCLERALFEAEARIGLATDLLQWARPASRAWQAREILKASVRFPRGVYARRKKERDDPPRGPRPR